MRCPRLSRARSGGARRASAAHGRRAPESGSRAGRRRVRCVERMARRRPLPARRAIDASHGLIEGALQAIERLSRRPPRFSRDRDPDPDRDRDPDPDRDPDRDPDQTTRPDRDPDHTCPRPRARPPPRRAAPAEALVSASSPNHGLTQATSASVPGSMSVSASGDPFDGHVRSGSLRTRTGRWTHDVPRRRAGRRCMGRAVCVIGAGSGWLCSSEPSASRRPPATRSRGPKTPGLSRDRSEPARRFARAPSRFGAGWKASFAPRRSRRRRPPKPGSPGCRLRFRSEPSIRPMRKPGRQVVGRQRGPVRSPDAAQTTHVTCAVEGSLRTP